MNFYSSLKRVLPLPPRLEWVRAGLRRETLSGQSEQTGATFQSIKNSTSPRLARQLSAFPSYTKVSHSVCFTSRLLKLPPEY